MLFGIFYLVFAATWGFIFAEYLITGHEPPGFTQGTAYFLAAWIGVEWAFDKFGKAW